MSDDWEEQKRQAQSPISEISVPTWWSDGKMLIRRNALEPDHPEHTYNYIARTYGINPEDYGVPNPAKEEHPDREAATPQLLEENKHLKAINAELVEMLDHVVERGLIYWEPQTTRGSVAKAEMIEKARAVTTKAQQVHQLVRQPSVSEPEQDRDLEPDL